MTSFLILLIVVAALWLWLTLSPTYARGFGQAINADTNLAAPDQSWPPVTLIVPARNEASVLPATIPTLCHQDYPGGVRVILIDDQSDDGSPAILEKLRLDHANLTLLPGSPQPDGWCGKPWAVTQGVRQATTDWLLFTDADCFFHPAAVRQAMALAQRDNFDLVSFFPQMTFGTVLERMALSGLATVLQIVMPLKRSNDPTRPLAIAAGGFILVRRQAYDRAGGHEAVKAELVEDINLAKNIKASGARIHTWITDDLVWTRMYEGAADLWEGLAKNAFAGMEYSLLRFCAGMLVALFAAVLPPAYFVLALWRVLRHPAPLEWLLVALSLLILACQAIVHSRATRHLRLGFWYILSMPLSAAVYGLICVRSAYQHYFGGGNLWKGRRYQRQLVLGTDKTQTKNS